VTSWPSIRTDLINAGARWEDSEVVEDGKTGLLVPPGHPEELAAALGRVLDNPALGRSLGQAGRRRVEAQFSWASVAERTEHVYADAIAEFKRSSGER